MPLRMGDVELLLTHGPVRISVPELAVHQPKQQMFFDDGSPCCFRHDSVAARFQCSKCIKMFCGQCVRELRVAGGTPRRFCPECGGACERLAATVQEQKRSSWLNKIVHAFTKPPSPRR